jgi:hypothetical protein
MGTFVKLISRPEDLFLSRRDVSAVNGTSDQRVAAVVLAIADGRLFKGI